MTPTRVIIDTDPGIDDALALLLALASPELSVEAITTVAVDRLPRGWASESEASSRHLAEDGWEFRLTNFWRLL